MFAETHKIISREIILNVQNEYDIRLDRSSLSWGSVVPDILPQYKLHRHYKKESIEYIVDEIVKLIYIYKNIDFKEMDSISMNLFSKRLGIISHYLSDFVCLPHAERWTFPKNMIKHLKYEAKLDDFSPRYDFKKNVINTNKIDIYSNENVDLKKITRKYIESVIDEYSLKANYENDLNFAVSLNTEITYFIIETVSSYIFDIKEGLVFEF